MAAATSGFVEWPAEPSGDGAPARSSVSGSLDEVAFDFRLGLVARGWAVAYDDPDTPVEVEILDGEVVLGRGLAAGFREDLRTAGIGSGAVAFAIELPPELLDKPQHLLALRLAGSDQVIVPPTAIAVKRFVGTLDGVEGRVVLGWAYDAARLGVPVVLEMLVDDEFAGHAIADQYRRDLAELGFANAYFGFEWVLPVRFADGQPHRIRARVANAEAELDGAVDDLLLLPRGLTAETRRLLDLHQDARQRLSAAAQGLRAEARRASEPKAANLTDLLLDSLDLPPLFEAPQTAAAATQARS
jgi:hypothetical protein